MIRAVKVKLAKPLVKPLLGVIRELCARPISPTLGPSIASIRSDRDELRALFHWSYALTGHIRIEPPTARPILRACAELRLHLHAHPLATLSAEAMRTDSAAIDRLPEPMRTAYLTYLFLSTLQLLILENFAPLFPNTLEHHPLAESGAQLGRVFRRLRQQLRGAPTPPPAPADQTPCRVVVIDDPVNLMAYVTAVFHGVLDLTLEDAQRHMAAVHEQGHTVAWTGPRAEAETRAIQLRAWHLTVRVEPD